MANALRAATLAACGLLVASVLVAAGLAWRLSRGPIVLGSLTPRLEAALGAPDGSTARRDRVDGDRVGSGRPRRRPARARSPHPRREWRADRRRAGRRGRDRAGRAAARAGDPARHRGDRAAHPPRATSGRAHRDRTRRRAVRRGHAHPRGIRRDGRRRDARQRAGAARHRGARRRHDDRRSRDRDDVARDAPLARRTSRAGRHRRRSRRVHGRTAARDGDRARRRRRHGARGLARRPPDRRPRALVAGGRRACGAALGRRQRLGWRLQGGAPQHRRLVRRRARSCLHRRLGVRTSSSSPAWACAGWTACRPRPASQASGSSRATTGSSAWRVARSRTSRSCAPW